MIWSSRFVSTRTVVSACGAAGAAFFSSFLAAGLEAADEVEPDFDGALAVAPLLLAAEVFPEDGGALGAACLAF